MTKDRPRTILLVEDNPDDALFAQRAFGRVCPEARLQLARDGEEAISYLSGKGIYGDRDRYPLPTLILLDLKLPRKSGFEVLERRNGEPEPREIPVVVLTSSDQPQDIARAEQLGVQAYHVKPVTNEELVATAKTICEAWSAL